MNAIIVGLRAGEDRWRDIRAQQFTQEPLLSNQDGIL